MSSGLTPKLPLTRGSTDDYILVTSYLELVKQNVKSLLLTNPGERIMDLNFGVGLSQFLFENDNPLLYSKITSKIKSQVSRYLPYISVEDVSFESNREDASLPLNFLKIRFAYNIVPLQTTDEIELTLPND
jgi:phage baseplate assembly protein W